MKRKKEIVIAGGGISGLSAAINLAKNGYKVIVHEATGHCCGRFMGDSQQLENWTYKEDILKSLKRMNIKTNFFYKPFKKIHFYSPSLKKFTLKSKSPIFYSVFRGKQNNSIDTSLKRQALKLGVKIIFNSKIKEEKADIIATGPKKAFGFALGILFKTKLKDRIKVIFNKKIAPGAYSYFSIVNGWGTLACCSKCIKVEKKHVEAAIKDYEKILKFKIKDKHWFGSYADFFIPRSAKKSDKLYVGEAAGFQDHLAGFGMRYAITSGYLAAKSIIENKDYDKLWKKAFLGLLKTSAVNRFLLERMCNKCFEIGINALKKNENKDGRVIARDQYNPSFIKKLIYPFAKFSMRRVVP